MPRRLINLAYGLLVASGSPVQELILLAVATGRVYAAKR